MKQLFFFILLVLMFSHGESGARDLLVDVENPLSSDAGSGTGSAPLKSIRRAFQLAAAGDTIRIRNGIYREQDLRLPADGRPEQPIRVVAEGSRVILRGTRPLDNARFRPSPGRQFTYFIWFDAFSPERVVETRFENWTPIRVTDPDNGASFLLEKPVGYSRVGSLPEVEQVRGSFYHDPVASLLYVHTFDGTDPAQGRHGVEVGQGLDGFLRLEGDHVRLQGLHFEFSRGLQMLAAHHSRLEQCTFLAAPLVVQGSEQAVVDSVAIENVISRGPTFQWHYKGQGRGFTLLDGRANQVRNLVVRSSWNGMTVKSQALNGPKNHRIDDISLWGFPNHALETENLQSCRFSRLKLWNAQDSLQVTNSRDLEFSNSIFVEGIILQYQSAQIRFRNNILFASMAVNPDSVQGFDSDYNLFLAARRVYKYGGSHFDSLSRFSSSHELERNSLQAPDQSPFQNFKGRHDAGNDFVLKSGSSAIDSGDPSFAVPEGGGSRIDIGCSEFIAGRLPISPRNLRWVAAAILESLFPSLLRPELRRI